MSAIYGFLRLDETLADQRMLDRMGHVLQHRGSDGQAALAFDRIGLGHCLLRVNREDRFEVQPMHDPGSGLTMVADVRLDNREALADALGIPSADLAEMADGALLFAAWQYWGEHCPERLIGDFTFAVWDRSRQRLYLVRDQMGQRGLFIQRGAGVLAFATEIKALWQIDELPRRLNPTGIGYRLLRPIHKRADVTLFDGVEVLPGGTIRWFDADGSSGECSYWKPRAGAEYAGLNDEQFVATYRRVLDEAIACRVRRLERPPLVLFSGGFDSGIIGAAAGLICAEQGHSAIALASVLPESERTTRYDARPAAQAFAGTRGLDLRYFVRSNETMLDDLDDTFARSDDCAGTDYVMRAAYRIAQAEGARLVMDGHGGDYTVNVRAPFLLGRILLRGHVRRFLREWRARCRFTGRSPAQAFRHDVLPALVPGPIRAGWYALRRGQAIWRSRMIAPCFAARLDAAGAVDLGRLHNPEMSHNRWQDRWRYLIDMVRQARTNQATVAASYGADFSRPFHDLRVVELGLAIPEHLQFRDGRERWLARQSYGDLLPAELLRRGPGNDLPMPDMVDMARDAGLRLLRDQGDRLRRGRAAQFIDFDLAEAVLHQIDAERNSASQAVVAASALSISQFVEWFERRNR